MSGLVPFKLDFTPSGLDSITASLLRAARALSGSVDLTPLIDCITTDEVAGAIVVGSSPSLDGVRVKALYDGGFEGFRAFVHLGTVHATLRTFKLGPFSDDSILEQSLAAAGETREGLERVFARFQLLHSSPDAFPFYERAWVEGAMADQSVLDLLLRGHGVTVDKGVLFWFAPGTNDAFKNQLAAVLMKHGQVVPPRSAAPKSAMQTAYDALVAQAR